MATLDANTTNSLARERVYFDGDCPLCRVVVETVEKEGKSDTTVFHNVHEGNLPAGVTKELALQAMHVVSTDGTVKKSAQALFSLLEQVPRWRPFARTAQWPLVLPVMEFGYRCISPRRQWLYGDRARVLALSAITILGLLASIILSWPLWFLQRDFPLAPIVHAPAIVHQVFFIGLLSAMVLLCTLRWSHLIFWVMVLSLAGLVFFDQMRLQPWVFHYGTILLLLASFSWRARDEVGVTMVLGAARVIVIAMYFWSGVQKLNPYFFGEVFPTLMRGVTEGLSFEVTTAILSIGFLVPFIEIAIGVCLLFPVTRKAGVIGASIMLVFVLAAIGPFGAAVNSVVWPWNIALYLMTVVLLVNTRNVSAKQILSWKGSLLKKAILVVFFILPGLSFFVPYDSYLSWSLYSGTVNQATLLLDNEALAALPLAAQGEARVVDGIWTLSLTRWSLVTLNVPPYPEGRVFESLYVDICRATPAYSEVIMTTSGRVFYTAGTAPGRYTCVEGEVRKVEEGK